MLNFKLEDRIKKFIEDPQNFDLLRGTNVLMQVSLGGSIEIEEFEDSAQHEKIIELESEIAELEVENKNLKESLKAAEKRIAELEEELE